MADDKRPQDKARELDKKDLEKLDGGATNVSQYNQTEADDPAANDMTDRTWKRD